MKNYIKLSDNYYLDTDELNYILVKSHIGKKGKSKDKEIFAAIRFFGRIEWLFQYLMDNKILEDKTIISNMEKIIKLKEDMTKMINNLGTENKI